MEVLSIFAMYMLEIAIIVSCSILGGMIYNAIKDIFLKKFKKNKEDRKPKCTTNSLDAIKIIYDLAYIKMAMEYFGPEKFLEYARYGVEEIRCIPVSALKVAYFDYNTLLNLHEVDGISTDSSNLDKYITNELGISKKYVKIDKNWYPSCNGERTLVYENLYFDAEKSLNEIDKIMEKNVEKLCTYSFSEIMLGDLDLNMTLINKDLNESYEL